MSWNESYEVIDFKTIKWKTTVNGKDAVSTILFVHADCPLIYAKDVSMMLTGLSNVDCARKVFIRLQSECHELKSAGRFEECFNVGIHFLQFFGTDDAHRKTLLCYLPEMNGFCRMHTMVWSIIIQTESSLFSRWQALRNSSTRASTQKSLKMELLY